MVLAVIDTFEFAPVRAVNPELLPRGGNIFIITYINTVLDGIVITVSVDALGNIGPIVQTLTFDAVAANFPRLELRSADILVVAHQGDGQDGFVRSIGIAASDDPIAQAGPLLSMQEKLLLL